MSSSPDPDWIRSIVHQYEGPLTLYATRLSGDVERARDVVQDTFLKLWETDRAGVDGHLAPWLYTVCRNRALDVRRKEQRMTTLNDQQMQRTAAPVPPPQDAGEAAREATGDMLVLISHLPERQQEVVRLKFQGGLSYREIAEVMDTTANNVGVLLHTAIKTIRQTLADQAAAGSKA